MREGGGGGRERERERERVCVISCIAVCARVLWACVTCASVLALKPASSEQRARDAGTNKHANA